MGSRLLFATGGFTLILTAIALGVGCFLMPRLLEMVVDLDLSDDQLPDTARWMLEHRYQLPFIALPALICGVLTSAGAKPRWAWSVGGLILLLAPLVVVLYLFITAMAPLYSVQPL